MSERISDGSLQSVLTDSFAPPWAKALAAELIDARAALESFRAWTRLNPWQLGEDESEVTWARWRAARDHYLARWGADDVR